MCSLYIDGRSTRVKEQRKNGRHPPVHIIFIIRWITNTNWFSSYVHTSSLARLSRTLVRFQLGYQKSLNISYADKFLNEIQKRFRDQYKDDLKSSRIREMWLPLFHISLVCFVEGFNRSFPFRAAYHEVLYDVEQADEKAKKAIRVPRSYNESDKKLKTVKIVTKKGDVAKDENKKTIPKKMAAPSRQATSAAPDDDEDVDDNDDEAENKDVTEQKATKNELAVVEGEPDDDGRVPLEEVQQQPTMTVAEKLAAIGKKPGPFSKSTPA